MRQPHPKTLDFHRFGIPSPVYLPMDKDSEMADNTLESSTPNYMVGFDDLPKIYIRQSAEKEAAFLLPRLKPGMRVFDIGCGPGSIPVGLAAAIAPGEFCGIGIEQSQIEIATSTG